MTLGVVQRSLLEKLAHDNGFDVQFQSAPEWAAFSSTEVPLRIWLGAEGERWVLALSQPAVAAELHGLTEASKYVPPIGAVEVREVADLPRLHWAVRRAYQLSRTLPDGLLNEFERLTKDLPQVTEVERLAVQRIGQDLFRKGLMDYWEGRCAVTGLSEPELLRASHIKPWAECESAAERLNIFNGLFLAVHLDAAFDKGLISFDDAGALLMSPRLAPADASAIGFHPGMKLRRLEPEHRKALAWHRTELFKSKS